MIAKPKIRKTCHFGPLLSCILLLSACQDANFLKTLSNDPLSRIQKGDQTVERDIEAPDVFRTSEAGLWDGRPALGGIWVAHPETDIPERVIITNGSNNKFVIGALFRRDTKTTGPRLVVSSEAAEALGMTAGVPVNLTVVALRKRTVAEQPASQSDIQSDSEQTLSPAPAASTSASASSAPPPKPRVVDMQRPFIQIGIFGVEQNAKNTAEAMRQMGIIPIVKTYNRNNRTFWRVLVGPATTPDEQMTLFQKVRTVGFKDAYAVTH